MMDRRIFAAMAVVVVVGASRPDAPRDVRFEGGSIQNALTVLAEAGDEVAPSNSRAFAQGYRHWSKGVKVVADGGQSVDPIQQRSPVAAGLVGIAAATGLRDLAALALYLRQDMAEDEGDWAMCSLCLKAIPFVDPHFVDAYTIRAYFFRKWNPVESEKILRAGLRWNPNDWELWHDLAWLYLRPNKVRPPDPRKALDYLLGGVKVKHPLFLRRLYAMVLFHLGKRQEAVAVYRDILASPECLDVDRERAKQGIRDIEAGVDRLTEAWRRHEKAFGQRDVLRETHVHRRRRP